MTLIDTLSLYSGGAERMAFEIASRLDAERFESTLCVTYWPPRWGDDAMHTLALQLLEERGTRFLGLPRRRSRDVWAWAELVRQLRARRIDVLHAHKFGSNVWGVITGGLARVPLIVTHEHSWNYGGNRVRRALDRHLIARGSDRFIAVSREDQRRMVEIEGIPRERTLLVPNGIAEPGPVQITDLRAELGFAPDVRLIGSVGSLYSVKAFDVLLRAMALIRPAHPDVRLVIAGTGPEQEPLESLRAELGLQESVAFLGSRNDVPSVLRNLELAVCCSVSEGTPLSVLEYMQAGLPVVATAVGGIPDLVEPGGTGLLAPPGDPDALAAALSEILSDPERGRAMGERGRIRQRTHHDIDAMVRRLESVYIELLEGRRPSPGSSAARRRAPVRDQPERRLPESDVSRVLEP